MKSVPSEVSFPEIEKSILNYWKENQIFEKSLNNSLISNGKEYVFYDGPPFATGLPHYGHLLAGTIKDVIGRFFTMKGYRVERKFGWDCHGVPVEFEIQKKLDLHGTKAIKEFGVGAFNEACREIVLRYTAEWESFVDRSGRWVDFKNQYRTMDRDFMESIWWVVSSLYTRGLIYEGLKCVPFSPGMSTALSNFEANLNYKTVQDPAVTVGFELISKKFPYKTQIVIWTTTPWTLPSNMAIAASKDLNYSLVRSEDAAGNERHYIIGEFAVSEYFGKENDAKKGILKGEVVRVFKGSELEGLEYLPPFSHFEKERENNAFKVYLGDFVNEGEGTGLVHMASFGEDDLELFKRNQITVVDPLDEEGFFTDQIPELKGIYFKEADIQVIDKLKKDGLLLRHRTIEHSYPFCWRTDKPLFYRSISSWFVRVESLKDLLIHNNSQINWVPSHIKEGRFGKWLDGVRDWAISRDRFWGNPIPIWKCNSCDNLLCIGSVKELEERSGEKVTDLHCHYIDNLKWSCERCSGEMKRIPQVLDCWFESGSMPYAENHYPFTGEKEFEDRFPADFIAEGLDQTRGWFYTLLVLSTALFGRPAFKNVIVNGIVLAEDGKKMSKSLKNYPPVDEIMDEIGADAMRLYLLTSGATRGEELRFSKEGVRGILRQTILPLWNAYNFLVTYALVDGWSAEGDKMRAPKTLLDKWIVSRTATLIEGVNQALTNYQLYNALAPVIEYVDQLTNWYIRLNRRRFWAGNSVEELDDKYAAYSTLHTAILSFVRVLAPLAPFITEEIFLNLSNGVAGLNKESVHLNPFPEVQAQLKNQQDNDLEAAMLLFEEVILLGRNLRQEKNLKVRQPLAKLQVIFPGKLDKLKLFESYIRDELNIKAIEFSSEEGDFVKLSARLNLKKLGGTLGKQLGRDGMKFLQTTVESMPSNDIRNIETGEKHRIVETSLGVDVELAQDDLLIERVALKGRNLNTAIASSGEITIMIDTELTQELKLEGIAREFVNRIQRLRKESNFQVSDRIVVSYMTACPWIQAALNDFSEYIKEEVLALQLGLASSEEDFAHLEKSHQEIEGKGVFIGISRVQD